MKKHFNLYYLLLEEKLNVLQPRERVEKTRQIIEIFFRKIKNSLPALPENKE